MNQAQLTLRTATDILDVVPTLVGFIPTESLVIIYLDTINARDRIAMTARIRPVHLPGSLPRPRRRRAEHQTTQDPDWKLPPRRSKRYCPTHQPITVATTG